MKKVNKSLHIAPFFRYCPFNNTLHSIPLFYSVLDTHHSLAQLHNWLNFHSTTLHCLISQKYIYKKFHATTTFKACCKGIKILILYDNSCNTHALYAYFNYNNTFSLNYHKYHKFLFEVLKSLSF